MSGNISIVSYPFAGGAGKHRAGYAPEIIREILEPHLTEYVDTWKTVETVSPSAIPNKRDEETGLKNFEEVSQAVTNLANQLASEQWEGNKSITLGGGHTQGLATLLATQLIEVLKSIKNNELNVPADDKSVLMGLANEHNWKAAGQKIDDLLEKGTLDKAQFDRVIDRMIVIWPDSHADYNDRNISPSGNIHGMPLAGAAGRDIAGLENIFGKTIHINPKNMYVVGSRDLDPEEIKLMEKDGVNYKPYDLHHTAEGNIRTFGNTKDEAGRNIHRQNADGSDKPTLGKVIDEIMDSHPDKKFIISFDVDVIHGRFVSATGTPMGLKMVSAPEPLKDKEDVYIRKNINEQSPAGPSALDAYDSMKGRIDDPRIVSIGITEASPAVGLMGDPHMERIPGLTLITAMKLLISTLGADINEIGRKTRENNAQRILLERIETAMQDERGTAI